MTPLLERLGREREQRRAQDLERRLSPPIGRDFSSNDYLGFAADPRLAAAIEERWSVARRESEAVGAPASRLLRGTTERHGRLEERLARLKGTEAALLFPSGYQANLGLLTSLLRPDDRALSDELNHASLIDGLRLAGCRKLIYPHLDVDAIEAALAAPHDGETVLVTESLYSMDGDCAPLDRYADLADAAGAGLIVDDAHALGLFGAARGSGLTEDLGVAHRATAIVSTFGKALGLSGACVAGPRQVIDHLVNRARSFVFTTAPPPLLLHALEAALDLLESDRERRRRPGLLADRLRGRLAAGGALPRAAAQRGPIVPVVVGDNRRALEVAAHIQEAGFDVRAVRPPTVPEGTARLRVSVHADHREDEIDALAEHILDALRRVDARGSDPKERSPRPLRETHAP